MRVIRRSVIERRVGIPVGLAIVVLVLTSSLVVAQTEETGFSEFHTWSDLTTIYKFSDRFRYDGDYGFRGVLTDDYWTLLFLRPSVRYRAEQWLLLHGGAALFYNFLSDQDDLPEIRPWVGIRFLGPRPGGFGISNYFRFELRTFYRRAESEWEATLRGRWQLQVTSPRFAIAGAQGFLALASMELFEDFDSTVDYPFGDRWRINFGLGKIVTPGVRIDLNYLFHRVRPPGASSGFELDDHVIRLRIFYRLNPGATAG